MTGRSRNRDYIPRYQRYTDKRAPCTIIGAIKLLNVTHKVHLSLHQLIRVAALISDNCEISPPMSAQETRGLIRPSFTRRRSAYKISICTGTKTTATLTQRMVKILPSFSSSTKLHAFKGNFIGILLTIPNTSNNYETGQFQHT